MYCNGLALYRNTIDCIVTETGHGLYCNTVTVSCDTTQALGVGRWALGAQALSASADGALWARRQAGAEKACSRGAATRHWGATILPHARGHARAWACWLGQLSQFWCLVYLTHFDSIFGLSTVLESQNEHCSSQNVFGKKIF